MAPSFADIFRGNAISSGLVPAQVTEEAAARLGAALADAPAPRSSSTWRRGPISVGSDVTEPFELADYAQWRLLEGLDDIGLTLRHDEAIAAFEGRRPGWLPAVS